MKKSSATLSFVTGCIANGTAQPKDEEDPLWYLRPVRLETQRQRFPRYQGCKSAGCRTLKECICRCVDCKRWCKYRGVTIVDTDGTVYIRYASGKLIVTMPRAEYETLKEHWEKLGLKLQPPAPVEAPTSGVTPV